MARLEETAPTKGPGFLAELPFLKEIRLGRRSSDQPVQDATLFENAAAVGGKQLPSASHNSHKEEMEEVLKDGVLSKTTITYKGDKPKVGPTRQRHFRLTEGVMEYFHQFSLVKVKRSFPLTSIEKVEYNAGTEPNIFRLIFSNYVEILRAETPEEASDWAQKIRTECRKWRPLITQDSILDDELHQIDEVPEEGEGGEVDLEDSEIEDSDQEEEESGTNSTKPATAAALKEEQEAEDLVADDNRRLRQRNEARFAELLKKRDSETKVRPRPQRDRTFTSLRGWRHHQKSRRHMKRLAKDLDKMMKSRTAKSEIECGKNFEMIKYPHGMFGLPTTKLFKLDPNNMQVMWRRGHHTRFKRSNSLSLHKVVEVREGQNTHMFNKFPYEQAEGQSFSLIYEQEDKRYAHLTALDVICDSEKTYDTWMYTLKSNVARGQHQGFRAAHPKMSNEDRDTTDATILWLRQIWSCESEEDEMSESTAIRLAKKFNPFASEREAKRVVLRAHTHQVASSHGISLGFQGFILMFNLQLDQLGDHTNSRLYSIYGEYAKKFPHLGMTKPEFRKFLIHECGWPRRNCRRRFLRRLMHKHDSYHQAFKKYVARNRSTEFVAGYRLLSFAGLLSFLRSQDNSAIDPEHETVYQDMTQPLSHYFINSSHNTYLEGDQLQGRSSTDAYVRTFLQGCRCVEIDCWDDSLNVNDLKEREPIIYHGFTLTTKIPFREVVHTIKEYGFINSDYPVIISIENHCSPDQQKKMAKIFKAIFGDMLPDKDLVEERNMDRLPSPQELRGKVILKGSMKKKEIQDSKKVQLTGIRKMLSKMASVSSLTTSGSIDQSRGSTPKTRGFTFKSLFKSKSAQASVSTDSPSETKAKKPATDSVKSRPGIAASGSVEKEPFCSKPRASSYSSVLSASATERLEASLDDDEGRSRHSSFGQLARRRLSLHKRNAVHIEEIQKKVEEFEHEQDEQEVEYIEIDEDLSSLIIYAKATSIKPVWDWKIQRATTVNQMFSLGEPKANELCNDKSAWKDMLACTERQFVRTYPKGTRFDSSNYDPMPMWRCGVQMVSLNFQYPDTFMHLNQGFFRRNGGCGYVLKPTVMRREDPGEGPTPFDPNMTKPHHAVPPIELEIELLSGQRLSPWKKRRSNVSVKIRTYGIKADTTADTEQSLEANHSSVLWPQWKKEQHVLSKKILMPELCLVYFLVEADRKIVGQNCISLVSLQRGIKFIPLRTPGGELIPGSGLFVKIKKKEIKESATEDEAGEDEIAQEPVRRLGKLGKQETIDFDDQSIGESEAGVLDDDLTQEGTLDVGNAFEVGGDHTLLIEEEEDLPPVTSSITRRYTIGSPTSFDRGAEFLSLTNPQNYITALVEVHETAEEN